MAYRYTVDDIRFVQEKFRETKGGTSIVNALYAVWRSERGTGTKRGDYTNFVSQMSPKSKKRVGKVNKILTEDYKWNVIYNIKACMKVDEKEALRIYKTRILPVTPGGFFADLDDNTRGVGLVSVRYHTAGCNDPLYFIYTTEHYEDILGHSPDSDVWTYRSESGYRDLLDGSLTGEDMLRQIRGETEEKWDSDIYEGGDRAFNTELVDVRILPA